MKKYRNCMWYGDWYGFRDNGSSQHISHDISQKRLKDNFNHGNKISSEVLDVTIMLFLFMHALDLIYLIFSILFVGGFSFGWLVCFLVSWLVGFFCCCWCFFLTTLIILSSSLFSSIVFTEFFFSKTCFLSEASSLLK